MSALSLQNTLALTSSLSQARRTSRTISKPISSTAFALARRLALGDRVIWMGKDDCQPSGPGTIIRITAHQVEVLWEGETARRYRRAQLYNLRHVKLISAAAEPRCKPPNRFESASFMGVCVVRPAEKQDQVSC